MRRNAFLCVVSIWTALGCACGTHRAYDGPRREPAAVARLETYREPRIHIFLDAIDGSSVPVWNDRAEVLPGRHVLETSVVIRDRGFAERLAAHWTALVELSWLNLHYSLEPSGAGVAPLACSIIKLISSQLIT